MLLGTMPCALSHQGRYSPLLTSRRVQRCFTDRQCLRVAAAQGLSAGVPDQSDQPAKTTRIRVERQTHLPATREEAWAALRQLVPPREWQQASGVFAALESIYRHAIDSAHAPGSRTQR